jgi:predicted flavoprotein YhiN
LVAGEAAYLAIDLVPNRSPERILHDLARQDPKTSLSNRLRKGAGIDGVKANLLRELGSTADLHQPQRLAKLIKALPVPVVRPRPIAEAISSAGGVAWEGIDDHYMLKASPGLFVAGEMIDWEAPTGGYLLTACFATGRAAARGIQAWLEP